MEGRGGDGRGGERRGEEGMGGEGSGGEGRGGEGGREGERRKGGMTVIHILMASQYDITISSRIT